MTLKRMLLLAAAPLAAMGAIAVLSASAFAAASPSPSPSGSPGASQTAPSQTAPSQGSTHNCPGM